MDCLAAVNWEDIILVGSAMGIFAGGKILHSKLTNSSNGGFSQRLCDEKHKTIDERHVEMRQNFQKVFDKLDTITEHLIK